MTICVEFPTIMSGLVLRWYADEVAYESRTELANSSRDYFWVAEGCPPEVRKAADDAHSYLSVEYAAHWHPKFDVSRWVTHRTKHLLNRELEPVGAPGGTPERPNG
jgi:hypothetical protein